MMVATALASAAAGGTAGAAPACALTAGEREQAAATVRALYAGMAADDDSVVGRLLSPDFYAFDGGQRLTGPGLLELVRKAHRDGVVLNWNLGEIDVHGGCGLAWAAWENHGSAGKPPAVVPVTWQESANLRRDHGRWRIEFLHAARAK